VASDRRQNSGLYQYIRHMMKVMAFDARRRGCFVSEAELNDYSTHLATAVTEALHYFIGHDDPSPQGDLRYRAVIGAHVTHMLRDTLEDVAAGYFNVPGAYLEQSGIHSMDVTSAAYRDWVKSRVELARACFADGRVYLAQVQNWRCRLAGYAYMARFEAVLDVIERDDYQLQAEYPRHNPVRNGLRLASSMFFN